MSKSDLLNEAIADAKAVKETALANAKLALQEAFTPKLESMFSEKFISEMEDEEEMDTDMDENVSDDELELEAIIRELEQEMKDITEDEDEDEGEEELEDEEDGVSDEELEAIRSAIANHEKELHGIEDEEEMESEDEEEMESEDEEEMESEDDEELDIESILRELEDEEDMMDEASDDEEMMDLESILRELEDEEDMMDEASDEEDMMDEASDDDEDISLEEIISAIREMEGEEKMEESHWSAEKEGELKEAYATIKKLKNTLNEVNILNAKLLYTNKLFRTFDLTENQKVKVLENFDRTSSLREVKLVYTTLCENLNVAKKKRVVKESMASKPIKSTKPSREIITESNDMAARFKYLANIGRKK